MDEGVEKDQEDTGGREAPDCTEASHLPIRKSYFAELPAGAAAVEHMWLSWLKIVVVVKKAYVRGLYLEYVSLVMAVHKGVMSRIQMWPQNYPPVGELFLLPV